MRYSAVLTNISSRPNVNTYTYEDYEQFKHNWLDNSTFKKELEGGIKIYFMIGLGINHFVYYIPETHPLFNYSFAPDYLQQYSKNDSSFYSAIKNIAYDMLVKQNDVIL